MVSLWCLLCKCSIYTLKSDQWITIWWAKFELECLLMISIYFNSIFKVTCKNGDFECQYIRTHSEEKSSEISNITFAILPFSHQNILTKLPSWVLWSLLLLVKISDALQNSSFLPKERKILSSSISSMVIDVDGEEEWGKYFPAGSNSSVYAIYFFTAQFYKEYHIL